MSAAMMERAGVPTDGMPRHVRARPFGTSSLVLTEPGGIEREDNTEWSSSPATRLVTTLAPDTDCVERSGAGRHRNLEHRRMSRVAAVWRDIVDSQSGISIISQADMVGLYDTFNTGTIFYREEIAVFDVKVQDPAPGSRAQPSSEAALDQFDLLRERIEHAREPLAPPLYFAVQKFIQSLLDNREDYADEGVIPQADGLDGLMAFLMTHQHLGAPLLSLARGGGFSAIWDQGRRARVRLDFLDSRRVKWVIVDDRDAPASGSGELDIGAIDRIIEAYHATDWMVA